jgi:predicted nucleic acid-binding protein
MGKKFLIDTNIIIYYLDNRIPDSQLSTLESIFKSSFNISTITKIELLGWHRINNEIKSKVESFLSRANVIYINSQIENKAIEIKQINKIPIPDAIIAATAIINNFTLTTRNRKDFEWLPKLDIYNPFEQLN